MQSPLVAGYKGIIRCTIIEHSSYLRTFQKCRKYSPMAPVLLTHLTQKPVVFHELIINFNDFGIKILR